MTPAQSAVHTAQAGPSAAARAHASHSLMTTGLAGSAAVLFALAVVAFWPNYLSRFAQAHAYTHAHAFFGTLWLAVLVAQPLLIRARKFREHRWLGRLASAVGFAFVVSGLLLARKGAVAMSAEQFSREGYSLYLPLIMAAIFTAAVCMGVAWRRVPAVHSRLMASSALPLLDPIIARIFYSFFPELPVATAYQVPAFILAAVIVWTMWSTLPRGLPGRAAFGNFAVFVTAALAAFFATPYSDIWLGLIAWLRSS